MQQHFKTSAFEIFSRTPNKNSKSSSEGTAPECSQYLEIQVGWLWFEDSTTQLAQVLWKDIGFSTWVEDSVKLVSFGAPRVKSFDLVSKCFGWALSWALDLQTQLNEFTRRAKFICSLFQKRGENLSLSLSSHVKPLECRWSDGRFRGNIVLIMSFFRFFLLRARLQVFILFYFRLVLRRIS